MLFGIWYNIQKVRKVRRVETCDPLRLLLGERGAPEAPRGRFLTASHAHVIAPSDADFCTAMFHSLRR